jgi:predicted permease
LLQQVLTESMALSAAGSVLGLLCAFLSTAALIRFMHLSILDISPDARVLGFTLAVSVLTSLLFGIVPAMQTTRPGLTFALKEETAGPSRALHLGVRQLLVACQVSVSLLLLIGAGLFIRTLANLKNIDAGFHADHVLLVSLNPELSRYSPERTRIFYDELMERVSALPGVRSVSLADRPLLAGMYIDGLAVEGKTTRSGEEPEVRAKFVTPGFFETMGIALRLGRDFSVRDRLGNAKIAIVNETLARQFFAGQNPIGKRVGVGSVTPDMTIVGVIADTKYGNLREPFLPTVYLPIDQAQFPVHERTLHLRTLANPVSMAAAVRDKIRALDKNLPVTKLDVFSRLIDDDLLEERLIAMLSGLFGGLALLLASIGLFGVMAYNVQRRTREIGIRMALGAERPAVTWMVIRDCVFMVTFGVALGFPLSFWLSKLVTSQLFGVRTSDPITMMAATLLLVAAALIAGFLPARRASRIDPMIALRYE